MRQHKMRGIGDNMNILLYEWNTFGQKDLEDTLIRLGHKVDKIKYVFTDFEKDEIFERKLSELLLLKRYDFVISFNFFQVVSRVCNDFCVKYIAWVWDCPLLNLNSTAIYNPFNYIFIFDGTLYHQMKYELHADTVYYLPLAVNTDRLEQMPILEGDEQEYRAEVSFVGNLYEKRNHYDEISNLPDYLTGYFDGIMRAQMRIYGYNFIKEMLTDDIMSELNKYIHINPGKNFVGDVRDIFADRFLNAKVTGLERRTMLGSLSEHYDVTLYTGSDTSDLMKVHNKGYIDYYKVMPKVFRYSKINLNMTLRTIKSGIPLRVFDILGAGGFLITNYQADIADYFNIGEDLVCYENEEDLIHKVGYYLEHEEERKQIAENGYRKVKQFHNYEVRLKEILRIASEKEDGYVQTTGREEPDTSGIIERIGELVWEGFVEEAKTEYYGFCRSNPGTVTDASVKDLDMLFQIHSYEKLRGQNTLFDYSRELKKVREHYEHLKELLLRLEESFDDKASTDQVRTEASLVRYVEANRVSYTAIEFIINRFSEHKVELLNRVAWAFYEAERNELVLPFLSRAVELAPKDDTTLAHLARILYRLGEYQMAYDYINEISIASPETMELMEHILKQI